MPNRHTFIAAVTGPVAVLLVCRAETKEAAVPQQEQAAVVEAEPGAVTEAEAVGAAVGADAETQRQQQSIDTLTASDCPQAFRMPKTPRKWLRKLPCLCHTAAAPLWRRCCIIS